MRWRNNGMARCAFVFSMLTFVSGQQLVFPRCLNETISNNPVSGPRYLIYSDGTLHNVSIPSAGWASARISGEIARIIIGEVMGYSTTLTDTESDLSNRVINWIVGCADPTDTTCSVRDTDHPRFHFSIESWMGAQERVAALPEDLRPTAIRTLDFTLDDTFFLMPRVINDGLAVSGCGLDWYRCYNAKWYQPHRFFDSWEYMVELLGVENLQTCSTDYMCQPPLSTTYLDITGDIESMGYVGSSYNIICENDYIWFSPACRHNKTLCVPMMIQYTRQNYMQLALFHNIPMAIVQILPNATEPYYAAAKKGRFLFGWYTPDDAMIDAEGNMPIILNFPRNNPLEYQQNIFKTGLASFYPINYCWPELPNTGNSADLMYFLKNLDLYDQDTDALMIRSRILKDQGIDEFTVARTAACEWVKANQPRWRLWIPIICTPGQYADTNRQCQPCPAGHYCSGDAAPADCPAGHYCPAGASEASLCPLGTEQPSTLATSLGACTPCKPGFTKTVAALVSCGPCQPGNYCPANVTDPQLCEPGTYADTLGLQQCKPCQPGTFAKDTGMSQCAPCPAGQSQPSAGQDSCVYCPTGSYAPADGATACTDCPFAHADTASVGSATVLDCGCQQGYFYKCLTVVDSAAAGSSSGGGGGGGSRRVGGGGGGGNRTGNVTGGVSVDNSSCYIVSPETYAQLDAAALAGFCQLCPDEGLQCPGGLGPGGYQMQPVARSGYALRVSQPYGSFECQDDDPYVCPGGPAGTCGPGRDGTMPACGVCAEGYFQVEKDCRPCESEFDWYDVLIAAVGVLAWIILFFRGAEKSAVADSSHADLVCAAAVIVRALSVVYIVTSNSKPTGGTPLGALGSFLESVLSQFTVIRPVCTMGRSFAARYLSKIFLYLALVALAWLAQHGRSLVCLDRAPASARMLNFLGMMLSGLYILIAKSVLLIFECRANPNGLETVLDFPDVLCDSPERQGMLPAAYTLTVALVVGVPAWFAWAVYHAPGRLDKEEWFSEATMFMFEHYKRERYYSGMLLLVRSLLLSLTGVLFPGSIVMQTAFFVCILSLSIVNTLVLRPYRSSTNNLLDSTLSLLLIWLSLANGADIVLSSPLYESHAPLGMLRTLATFSVYAVAVVAFLCLAREAIIILAHVRDSPPAAGERQLIKFVRRISFIVNPDYTPAAAAAAAAAGANLRGNKMDAWRSADGDISEALGPAAGEKGAAAASDTSGPAPPAGQCQDECDTAAGRPAVAGFAGPGGPGSGGYPPTVTPKDHQYAPWAEPAPAGSRGDGVPGADFGRGNGHPAAAAAAGAAAAGGKPSGCGRPVLRPLPFEPSVAERVGGA